MIDWIDLLNKTSILKKNAPAEYPHLEWVHAEKQIPSNACDEIIHLSKNFKLEDAQVVGEDVYPGHRQASVRLLESNQSTQSLFSFIFGTALLATKYHFHLTLTGITRSPQYVEYTPGKGQVGWHNDYSHGGEEAPRKLTMVIQLSYPEEYDGGNLQLFGIEIETLPKARGSVLIFPSICPHRVTPVICGTRKVLVAWIAGSKFI